MSHLKNMRYWLTSALLVMSAFGLQAQTQPDPRVLLNNVSAAAGQVLVSDGTKWVPGTLLGNQPDSTWAKLPGGGYTGKRITDNTYRVGKAGIGTTDTTAMLNLRAKNPVGSVLTTVQKISAPPRSAFTDGIFADNSNFTASELDINPMKPNHFPSWNYGIWKEKYSVDSTTNLAVLQPGNAIRQWGFNLDNLEPKLARWYWNTEQLFYPGSGGSSAWEHYLELYDTLGRHERIFQLFGLHNGNSYEVDFAADDWHIRKPHTTNFALRIRPAVGLWHTDYPYSFRINNTTRTGPLIERLHSGTYRNVLDWTTNGRLDVGDLGGVRLNNRLVIGGTSGFPKIISETTNLRLDSTELYIRTSGNRHLRMETYGSSDYFDLGFDNTQVFFRGSGSTIPMLFHKSAPNYALTINSTGRVGVGLSSAYSTLDIQQHTNGLDGSLRLVPVTGNYAGLFVNANNELAFNRGGANRMFLTNAGQLKLPSYTSTASYPITPAGVLGFNSAGEIGTVAYDITGGEATTIGNFQPTGTLKGLSLSGTDIRLHTATISTAGAVDTVAQSWKGQKEVQRTSAATQESFRATNTGTGGAAYGFKSNGVTLGHIYADESGSQSKIALSPNDAAEPTDYLVADGDVQKVIVQKGIRVAVRSVAGSTTIAAGDYYVRLSTSTAATYTFTLPAGAIGDQFVLLNDGSAGVILSVVGNGSDTVENTASITIGALGETKTFTKTSSTNWDVK